MLGYEGFMKLRTPRDIDNVADVVCYLAEQGKHGLAVNFDRFCASQPGTLDHYVNLIAAGTPQDVETAYVNLLTEFPRLPTTTGDRISVRQSHNLLRMSEGTFAEATLYIGGALLSVGFKEIHPERAVFHYQRTGDGLRIAYKAEVAGDPHAVVRTALDMKYVEAKNPLEIAGLLLNGRETSRMRGAVQPGITPEMLGIKPYIIDGPLATVYHNPLTALVDTMCTVEVPKNGGHVDVGINSRLPLDPEEIENFVRVVIIDRELTPAGLVPVESERKDVPQSFLRLGL